MKNKNKFISLKNVLLFLLAFCLFNIVYSQEILEKTINTEVNEVTVYIDGAQITRKKTIDLNSSVTILKFVNLSPFIEAKSIQIKANGNTTVLSVNHQQNFIDKLEKSNELVSLEKELTSINDKIKIEKTFQEIITDELTFLRENRKIGGKNEELSLDNLKNTASFYSSKITELKFNNIERDNTLLKLNNEKVKIEKQINTLSSTKEYANGEILVKIESKNNIRVSLELSYLVSNAGWLPTYDIRAKNVNQPIELVYKANVRQDTKVDWKNVKLKLSSAEPNISGVAPELRTYFLDYYTPPPVYNRATNLTSGMVSGIVSGDMGPLPGASILIKGTTIGTETDFDGRYTITLPNETSILTFSYIGMETKDILATNSIHNVVLQGSGDVLEEVVITAYGTGNKLKSLFSNKKDKAAGLKSNDSQEHLIPLVKVENQTTVDFEIDMPYTVLSDNKRYTVNMINYNLPAEYKYYSVPKIEKNAFLIAKIQDWEQYNLLEGEANIFFENTYVGKTLLDVRYTSDTLNISLGRDKNVSVNREKGTDFESKKFIGTKKEEIRDWDISIKNNKPESINLVILDQVPVSTIDEIKVEILELSKGILDTETGEVKWIFKLEPNKKRNIDLKYLVKYPKNRNLMIE